jgi:hypothetical protein
VPDFGAACIGGTFGLGAPPAEIEPYHVIRLHALTFKENS